MSAQVTPGTVLVVDDDEDTSMLLGLLFRRQGWITIMAGSLEQARVALATHEVTALLTDVRLPDGSGATLLARGRPAHLRAALLMSGNGIGEQDGRIACARDGFDDYVCKPFDAGALVARVATLLTPAVARSQ